MYQYLIYLFMSLFLIKLHINKRIKILLMYFKKLKNNAYLKLTFLFI